MQTLRKKTSPLKYKNETTRFLGDGVSFKAKLIGILEVSEARGDRMCQEALSDLKMAIRAAGEHKQRITINIAIDGLRLRDEKTGDSLYHHPVHKISFIAQDMTDSRAFGYIFGSPDTGHRFFGIKTDKAASQVVIAMRDLFQVVFALKKKEIELAKSRYATTTSPLFSDSTISSVKSMSQETSKSTSSDNKAGGISGTDTKTASGTTAVADLVDLELELNSLQQGLNQMERITPSSTTVDPFGDSFTTYTKPILPPPPSSGRDRSNRSITESTPKSSVLSDLISSSTTPPPAPPPPPTATSTATTTTITIKKEFGFPQDETSSDWFATTNSLFEEPPPPPPPAVDQSTKDEKHELTKKEIMSQFDVFTELDPLGTGRSKPYIDKKLFFQELKNPPKKVLNDLVSQAHQQHNQPQEMCNSTTTVKSQPTNDFTTDPFGEDPFVSEDPFADSDFIKQDDPFESVEFNDFKKNFNNFDTKIKTKSPKNSTIEIGSLEAECAPEPPPRPIATLLQQQQQQIKPPPLPPKKQSIEMAVKPPPPRPVVDDPHSSLYEYIYDSGQNNFEFNNNNNNNNKAISNNNNNNIEKTPPLPVPVRKTKFDADLGNGALQHKLEHQKQLSIQSSDEDYLTPINVEQKQIDLNLDGLDITLSQLTLSGLNQLATKLNIPANQLSNMTLVQLTNYLSNFIKSKTSPTQQPTTTTTTTEETTEFPAFKADFATNFNPPPPPTTTTTATTTTNYDRYAVFRELIQEEIKQTKIDTEPEELQEEKKEKEKQLAGNLDVAEEEEEEEIVTSTSTVITTSTVTSTVSSSTTPTTSTVVTAADKYAALREIVESELRMSTNEQKANEDDINVKEQNILNTEKCSIDNDDDKSKYNLIEYNQPLKMENEKVSPVIAKSPPPPPPPQQQQINEIPKSTSRINSGSLSDIISGSSPENDSELSPTNKQHEQPETVVTTTITTDVAGESWAIFDQNQTIKEKPIATTTQSEEGVSPWSSDSKEFGNGSPPEWRDSSDRWPRRRNIKHTQEQRQQPPPPPPQQQQPPQETWWDTSAEPEVQQFYSANRRSTDSYDDEYYECYERPRRRKQYSGSGQTPGGGGGGHSSSSRDVSPWEDEPRTRRGDWGRHVQRFEKLRDRRHTDSWDDDDDYDYEEERAVRFHHTHRRDHDDRWMDDWSEDRRYRRAAPLPPLPRGERWCCPDWEDPDLGRYPSRYPLDHPSTTWHDRYRESQESPWEDDYSNGADDMPPPPPVVASQQYLTTGKRNWKRPSSASEMDRKTGDIKSRHYLMSGGSDGERERRYKPNRRSRSRDSQYSEPILHRHKSENNSGVGGGGGVTMRTMHRSRPYFREPSPQQPPLPPTTQLTNNKKSTTLSRKKVKESDSVTVNTFPRKSATHRNKSLFENDFVATSEDSPPVVVPPPSKTVIKHQSKSTKFNFDNDFETSEAESPTLINNIKNQPVKEPTTKRYQQSSLFEDDFSPSTEKLEQTDDSTNISSIKEEIDDDDDDDRDNDVEDEMEDSFSITNQTIPTTNTSRKKKLNRFSTNGEMLMNLKKSESVNIFARENDPFDDDFFSQSQQQQQETTTKTTDLKWTEDLDFNLKNKKK